jgi:hypothetical protein
LIRCLNVTSRTKVTSTTVLYISIGMSRKPYVDYPQTPQKGQIFLDHVAWFVPDMNGAGRAFERLGFSLTPFVAQNNADPGGGPPVPAGTGNRCAMLRRGYLEILSAVEGIDTPLVRQLDTALDRYKGVHLIAFSIADPEAEYERLENMGFSPQDPVYLRRPLVADGKEQGEVAFTVLRVPPALMKEGRIQMLRQETPDLVWEENLLARENGVSALAAVLLAVENPGETASRFSRFTGKAAVGDKDYFTIELDRGRIAIMGQSRCLDFLPGISLPKLPYMAAVVLESPDPTLSASYFCNRGVPCNVAPNGILQVDATDSEGTSLVIVKEGFFWPPRTC